MFAPFDLHKVLYYTENFSERVQDFRNFQKLIRPKKFPAIRYKLSYEDLTNEVSMYIQALNQFDWLHFSHEYLILGQPT